MQKEVDGVLVAAHELKAPLAVMRQLAFALGDLKLEDERIRTEMIRVSDRAIKQVNDLVKVRRLEDGLFEMEPVAVREVCDAASRELEKLYYSNRRGLKVKYSNRERLVVANRDLLYSVVYNFLLNAMHYSEDGSETRLMVNDCRDRVRITVRDFGPELPVGIWRKLRDGWMEQPTEIAMRPGSSGLGLFIASSFSRYMGSKIGVIRHRDGTSFSVELPISKQASLF